MMCFCFAGILLSMKVLPDLALMAKAPIGVVVCLIYVDVGDVRHMHSEFAQHAFKPLNF